MVNQRQDKTGAVESGATSLESDLADMIVNEYPDTVLIDGQEETKSAADLPSSDQPRTSSAPINVPSDDDVAMPAPTGNDVETEKSQSTPTPVVPAPTSEEVTINNLMHAVLHQLINHEFFRDFCSWCDLSKDYFNTKDLDMDSLDKVLASWIAFGRVSAKRALDGPTEKYMNAILERLPENPTQDPRFTTFSYDFRHERRAEPDRLRHPFCSFRHVQSDYVSYQQWVVKANLLDMELKRDMVRIMSHSLWSKYVNHVLDQGADACDFATLDAVMAGDPQATLEEWNDFIDAVDWLKQDYVLVFLSDLITFFVLVCICF